MKARDYARTLTLAAPSARAFDAIATLEGLAGWWASSATGSTRVGGTIRLAFEGLDEHIDLAVVTRQRPKWLVWRVIEHTSLEEWNGTSVHFALDANAGGCTLSFKHAGLTPALACFDDCSSGWDHFLDSLESFVTTGRGQPFTSKKRRARAESFADVVAAFAGDRQVEAPAAKRRAFGSNGLKVGGKIFAMTVKERLVVKLPRERVAAMIQSGEGVAFDPGRGRVMREWVVVSRGPWIELAREARRFVAGASPAPRRTSSRKAL